MNSPQINVTPLIDVLLVLLIIFMVVSPLKPRAFPTRVPSDQQSDGKVHPQTLAVIVNPDLSVDLNSEMRVASVADTSGLITRLKEIFAQRVEAGDISSSFAHLPGRPANDRIERMVFIKAPRSTDYGSVVRVVDAVKSSGAFPISLQIDRLN
jgi:biopolymer transport protein ExbD